MVNRYRRLADSAPNLIPPWFRSAVPYGIILLATAYVSYPLFAHDVLGKDHAVHLFKAWQLFTGMLPAGKLSGWSHQWTLGYPTGDLVPAGEEIWTSLFRIVTFGSLSWNATYRLSLIGLYLLQGIATFEFGQRYFGKTAATLSATLVLLDNGELFQGGWIWHTAWGVWPITLGLSLVLLTFAKLEDALNSAERKHIILASGLLFAALIAHQISLLLLVIGIPFLLLDHWTRSGRVSKLPWLRVASACAIGGGLAAFSVLPLLARGYATLDRGRPGESLAVWGQRIAELKLFEMGWPILAAAGMVGAIRACRSRKPGGLFVVLVTLLCFLGATNLLIDTLHAERVLPSLAKLELGRMVQVAKSFWFPLAAYGLVEIFRGGRLALPLRKPPLLLVARLLPLVLLLPFVPSVSGWIYRTQIKKTYQNSYPVELYRDFLRVNEWAAQTRKESHEFYRIAYRAPGLQALQNLSPMLSNTPVFRADGPTPSHQFIATPCDFDLGLLKAASVKYVVSEGTLSEPELELAYQSGQLNVYHFKQFKPELFTIIGTGEGQLKTFAPELVEIDLRNVGPATRLRLAVANYERWEATQNGKTLKISPAPAYGNEFPYLMQVPAANGLVRFRYVYRTIDVLGTVISATALLMLGLLVFVPNRLRDALSIVRVGPRVTRWLWIPLTATVLLALAIFIQRANTLTHLLPKSSLFHQMGSGTLTLGSHPCAKLGELDYACDPIPLQASYVYGNHGVHLCMSAQDHSSLEIRTKAKLGSAVIVRYDTGEGQGTIQAAVNGESLGQVQAKPPSTDFQYAYFDTDRFASSSSSELYLRISGGPLRCFDIEMSK
jgi:hypothetical protein